jgi:hypothetical protein
MIRDRSASEVNGDGMEESGSTPGKELELHHHTQTGFEAH